MSWRRVWMTVWGNIVRNPRAFVLSSVGLVVGVGTFVFFVALGAGIQDGVLNRIYPVNQVELEPRTVGVLGLREGVLDAASLGPGTVASFEALPDVAAVYPKMRSKLQARLWGGKALFGFDAKAEAFFDGLDPALIADELAERERVEEKLARASKRRPEACRQDEECPLGQSCRDGQCSPVLYFERFADMDRPSPCREDDQCVEGEACVDGLCQVPCGEAQACGEGQVCAAGACAAVCAVDGDCATTHACVEGSCQRMACSLSSAKAQFGEAPKDRRGVVAGRCSNGVDPSDPACEPMGCAGGTYCAPAHVGTADGWCETPLPVVLSPFLLEVFNSSVATSLGLQPLDGIEALLGVEFRLQLGNSFFTRDLPEESQQVKRAQIVGWSDKALDFGVTMPLSDVRRINARTKGRDVAGRFDTFILETEGNEDVSGLIAEAEARGFTLSRKSQDARKAADLLFILTVVFSFISLVIMGVSAVNILHTFLMLVTERRYEIGILRAVGARRADVRRLVLLEAAALGAFGAVLGEVLAYGFAAGANGVAAAYLSGIPFKPDDFFVFEPWALAFGIAFGVAFCLLGAFVPAQRAAKLDPAVVLTG